jgi:hypothetical protein
MQEPDPSSNQSDNNQNSQRQSPPPDDKINVSDINPIADAGRDYLSRFFAHVQYILMHPQQFFVDMPKTGGFQEPLIFYITCAAINCVVGCAFSILFLNFNFMGPILMAVAQVCALYLASAITNFTAQAVGGKGNYESTFRVFAYSGVNVVLSAIPFGIGILLSFAYGLILTFFGVKHVHQLNNANTIIAILVSAIITAPIIFLAGCALMVRSIFPF